MNSEPESFIEFQTNLWQIYRNWKTRVGRVHKRNRQSAVPLEPPAVERLIGQMRSAACHYVQRRQVEVCPTKGALDRDQGRLQLLHQARDVHHQALGTAKKQQAHVDPGKRERIVLGEACGDLERAAPPKLRHLFRCDESLKAALFHAEMAQIDALLDRRDEDEWWFPDAVPSAGSDAAEGDPQVQSPSAIEESLPDRRDQGESLFPDAVPSAGSEAAEGCPQVPLASAIEEPSTETPIKPESPRRPGKRPKHETGSYRLVDSYLSRLKEMLEGRLEKPFKVTKSKLAQALKVSRDTLNVFEREALMDSDTRNKIQAELTAGPTEPVIACFSPRKQSSE
jgi:hypothetical protein